MADELAGYGGYKTLLFDRPAPFVLRITINAARETPSFRPAADAFR